MIEEDYAIVSVEPTDLPRDMVGTGWHCYIIEHGKKAIRGYQQGNIKDVTRAVEEIVARLSERRYGKKGRVHLTMSAPAKNAERKQACKESLPSGGKSVIVRRILAHIDLRHLLRFAILRSA